MLQKGPISACFRPVFGLISTRFQARGGSKFLPVTFSPRGPSGGAGSVIWGHLSRLLATGRCFLLETRFFGLFPAAFPAG